MRRKVFLLTVLLTIAVGGLMSVGLSSKASGGKKDAAKGRPWASKIQGPLSVTVTPVGPTQAQVDDAVRAVRTVPAVQKYLDGAVVRQLQFELLDMQRFSLQQRYRVT